MNNKKNLFTVLGEALYTVFDTLRFVARVAIWSYLFVNGVRYVYRNLIEPRTRVATLVFLAVAGVFVYTMLLPSESGDSLPPVFNLLGRYASTDTRALTESAEPSALVPYMAGAGMIFLVGVFIWLCRIAKRRELPTQDDRRGNTVVWRAFDAKLVAIFSICIVIAWFLGLVLLIFLG